MKRFYFLILMSLFLLTISFPVSAASTADGKEICSYKSSNGTQWSWCMANYDVNCYAVYFSEENYYWIISTEAGSVYHNGFTTSSLPQEFAANKCSKLMDASGLHTAKFKIYFGCATSVAAESIIYENFDYIFATRQEFLTKLAEYDSFEDFNNDNNAFLNNGDRLPLPTFKISQAFTTGKLGEGASVKYTFNWKVSEHQIYANNPNKYNIQMLATANYTEKTVAGLTQVVANRLTYINPECNTYVTKGVPIYKESYSFLEQTYRNILCDIAGVNKNYSTEIASYYYLFVRVIESETGKTSFWKVYKCQGRSIAPTGYYYDDEGREYPGDDNEDEIDDSINYDDDPGTDDVDDPNSPAYNDGSEIDAQHLINNLEEIVSTLKGVPELFTKVFGWMPDYLIVLIVTSIGLIVVVGFVKIFFH